MHNVRLRFATARGCRRNARRFRDDSACTPWCRYRGRSLKRKQRVRLAERKKKKKSRVLHDSRRERRRDVSRRRSESPDTPSGRAARAQRRTRRDTRRDAVRSAARRRDAQPRRERGHPDPADPAARNVNVFVFSRAGPEPEPRRRRGRPRGRPGALVGRRQGDGQRLLSAFLARARARLEHHAPRREEPVRDEPGADHCGARRGERRR